MLGVWRCLVLRHVEVALFLFRGLNEGEFMFCEKCGNEISDDARFCPKCGVSLSKDVVSSEESLSGPSANATTSGFMKLFVGVVICGIEIVAIHVLYYGVLGCPKSRAPAMISLAAIGGTWALFERP